MFTYMAVLALASTISTANLAPNPNWLSDYKVATKRVADVHKPMVVFVGSGSEGWNKVVREGALDTSAKKLLSQQFVCVYVDTDTVSGRSLAENFEVARRGLVISDRAGTSQAYSLSGDLTSAELVKTLEKYTDADVKTTETLVREAPIGRTISYPAYTQQYRPTVRYSSGSA